MGRVRRSNPKVGEYALRLVHFGESTFFGGNIMKSSTKDEINGEKDKIKGNIKEGLGSLSGNRDLEEEGKDDQLKGKARKKVGEIKRLFNQ